MNRDLNLIVILAVLLISVSGVLGFMLLNNDDREPVELAADAVADTGRPAASIARFTRAATVGDPAGFANVRDGPSIEHNIITRVEAGETLTTYPQSGDWWEVRTADGNQGYMASEAIAELGSPATVPVAQMASPAAPPNARAPDGRADMIFADSDRRALSGGDIAGLSGSQLRIARNEIYARRGRIFNEPNLRRYFESQGWYRPMYREVSLNSIEQANVALLQRVEGR